MHRYAAPVPRATSRRPYAAVVRRIIPHGQIYRVLHKDVNQNCCNYAVFLSFKVHVFMQEAVTTDEQSIIWMRMSGILHITQPGIQDAVEGKPEHRKSQPCQQ